MKISALLTVVVVLALAVAAVLAPATSVGASDWSSGNPKYKIEETKEELKVTWLLYYNQTIDDDTVSNVEGDYWSVTLKIEGNYEVLNEDRFDVSLLAWHKIGPHTDVDVDPGGDWKKSWPPIGQLAIGPLIDDNKPPVEHPTIKKPHWDLYHFKWFSWGATPPESGHTVITLTGKHVKAKDGPGMGHWGVMGAVVAIGCAAILMLRRRKAYQIR